MKKNRFCARNGVLASKKTEAFQMFLSGRSFLQRWILAERKYTMEVINYDYTI